MASPPPNVTERELAMLTAWSTAGVKRVQNNIVVLSCPVLF